MLQVDVSKIIPLTEARDSLNKIVDDVDNTDEMYVLTKNGTPTAVVVGVNHLEKLTNEKLPDDEKTGKEPEKSSSADSPAFQPAPAAVAATDDKSDDLSPIQVPVTPPPTSNDQAEADTVQATSPADDLFNDFSDINQSPEGGSPGGKSIFDEDDAETPASAVTPPPAPAETPTPPPIAEPAPAEENPTPPQPVASAPPQAMSYDDFIAQPPPGEPAAEATDTAPSSQFEVPSTPATDAETPDTQATEEPEPASTPGAVTPAPSPNPIASTPPSHPNYTYGSSNQGTSASSAASTPQQPDF